MNLSKHFTLEELTKTSSNLDNSPDAVALTNLTILCRLVLEPIRELLGIGLKINSGYRSAKVNANVNGSKTSQHLLGQAADFVPLSGNLWKAFVKIVKSNINFDQIIYEFDEWIHVSFAKHPRKQVLKTAKVGGKTNYIKLDINSL